MELWMVYVIGIGGAGVILLGYLVGFRGRKSSGKVRGKDEDKQAQKYIKMTDAEIAEQQRRSMLENAKALGEEIVTVRIYDCQKRQVYNEEMESSFLDHIKSVLGTIGRKWFHVRSHTWVYALIKDILGGYAPLYVPETLNNPPSKLFRARQQQETGIVYDVRADQGFIQKYGATLLFVFGVLFVMFMMSQD